MTESLTRLARDRLQHLSATLTLLRERVREAVASEMGKAVGDALRDLVTSILSRTATAHSGILTHTSSPPPRDRDQWDDDPEQYWDDEARLSVAGQPSTALPKPLAAPAVAVGMGVGFARWMMKRRMPIWAALGAGFFASLAALSQHPLVQSGLALAAAAAELVAITDLAAYSP